MYVKLTKPKKSKNLKFEYLTEQGKQKLRIKYGIL